MYYFVNMSEEKESKKDELLVMKLVGEGINKLKQLQKRLKWSQERVEKTIETLRKNEYVKTAGETGEEVIKITDRGRKELPKLMGEVIKESRDFIGSVSDSFQKHFYNVFPKIKINIEIEEPKGEEKPHVCKKCGQEFETEHALEIHQGSEH